MHTMTLKAQSEALVSGLVVGCVVKGGENTTQTGQAR